MDIDKLSKFPIKDDEIVGYNVNRLINTDPDGMCGGHSKFGPSSLKRLFMCPGSYWLKNFSSKAYKKAAADGTTEHSILEKAINERDLTISAGRNCEKMAKYAINILNKSEDKGNLLGYGVESELSYTDIRFNFKGTCDFWILKKDPKKGIVLTVADYKNGFYKLSPHNNIQLLAYTLMIINNCVVPATEVNVIENCIWQKKTKRSCKVSKDTLKLAEEHIRELSALIDDIKFDVFSNLDKDCDDPFCRAYRIHKHIESQP